MNTKKRWKIEYNTPRIPAEFSLAGYNPLLASVLVLKGYHTSDDAKYLFYDGKHGIHDPFLLKGMEPSVSRIVRAISSHEKIAVFGDYDVDGITSTCLVTDYLRSLGCNVTPYIPDRSEEGYGLNCDALDSFRAMGITLVITVDCGITATEESVHAKELGISMIITDHHECKSDDIPDACAVINPKQAGCNYPNKNLAGVGVAFKLITAIAMRLSGPSSEDDIFDRYCDLVSIGTVADVMPLTDENRVFVREGLKKLRAHPRPGIAAMLREASVEPKNLNASSIGFTLAPRLNAAGRLGKAIVAGYLLMSEDEHEAANLASELCSLNRQRQAIENSIWNEASGILNGKVTDSPIVLASDSWHQGVIGIAASRLAEQYSLPTIMICLNGDVGKGSCRSYGGFNLYDALSACSSHLLSFGGHALAAGLNIRKEKIEDFRVALGEYYRANRPEIQPEVSCDLLITDPGILTEENVRSLDLLEPYGNCNPKPVMCMTGVILERLIPIGGDKHSKLKVRVGNYSFDAVYFSHSVKDLDVTEGSDIDIAFSPQINEYRGTVSVQLMVSAVRPHDPYDLCEEILAHDSSALEAASAYCPERQDFVRSWRRIEHMSCPLGESTEKVIANCPEGLKPEKYCICLKAFQQAGLLTGGTGVFGASVSSRSGKADLESTAFLSSLRKIHRY